MIDTYRTQSRTAALNLALKCHEDGHQDEGATVMETAELFRDFIEAE
ncbi:hypothetical protein SEA_HAMMY_1 [Mycobacterium phage Hammy]|uniref:Gene 1 ring forming protein domain-containing protein n=2 Tax=Amginevirus TaxID=2946794 RepID=A0A222ZNC6_9CAUD|nr:hypothetical protein I5G85_gp01 [Mycobacterium phage Amohnition]YP_009951960.1 hypothetical protein I5G86_gp01 [Mycobacterium phage DarthP]APD18174.1 hypothetical protein SEA_HAMMY_1 [Mycobacterium phage Hammy]ASR86283.1 hypothetical protein SEA_AMOHNITION_1 [Mycobacterium phage Amohnition]ASW31748.1 hypothetical protein SEA_DARTHP_1 [Mycobacterium phage DarthP]